MQTTISTLMRTANPKTTGDTNKKKKERKSNLKTPLKMVITPQEKRTRKEEEEK